MVCQTGRDDECCETTALFEVRDAYTVISWTKFLPTAIEGCTEPVEADRSARLMKPTWLITMGILLNCTRPASRPVLRCLPNYFRVSRSRFGRRNARVHSRPTAGKQQDYKRGIPRAVRSNHLIGGTRWIEKTRANQDTSPNPTQHSSPNILLVTKAAVSNLLVDNCRTSIGCPTYEAE